MEELTTRELEQKTGIVEWGRWSRGGLPTGKPGEGCSAMITDEEALKIDQEMAWLKQKYFKLYYVLVEMYKWEQTIRDLVKTLKISNREIMSHRDKGLSILYGRLSGKVETMHQ
jgi:hypothetical protein